MCTNAYRPGHIGNACRHLYHFINLQRAKAQFGDNVTKAINKHFNSHTCVHKPPNP